MGTTYRRRNVRYFFNMYKALVSEVHILSVSSTSAVAPHTFLDELAERMQLLNLRWIGEMRILSERRAELRNKMVVRVRIVAPKTMQLLIEPYRSRTQSMSAW